MTLKGYFSHQSAAAVYYVLCTYVSPPTDSFSEEAVYPPRTIEEEEERLRSLGRTSSVEDFEVDDIKSETPADDVKWETTINERNDFV
jgi:NCS1 family nucleobase:cation symporter-1